MGADRPQCTATWNVPGRGVVRCTLPAGPHNDPQLGAYHQAPSEYEGGLTLWHDRAIGATPAIQPERNRMSEQQQTDLTSPEAVQASQQVYERITAGQAGDVTAELNAIHGREG
jgi:hypothetical protein